MQYVSLDKYPNQRFTLQEGDVIITFNLRYFRGITYVTVTDSSGGTVITSMRAVNNAWIFPPNYENEVGANYRFEDEQGDYPVFENFNGSCVLTRYTAAEATEERITKGMVL